MPEARAAEMPLTLGTVSVVMFQPNDTAPDCSPVASTATADTLYAPGADGVPTIVLPCTDRPGGRPDTSSVYGYVPPAIERPTEADAFRTVLKFPGAMTAGLPPS